MKILSVAGAVIFLASQFLCQVYAIELCEPQDYYNLANASKCSIQYNKAGNKGNPRDAMFEIMKSYPFENKDAFVKLLQRKIELVDNYKTQQQDQGQTEKVKANISKLEYAKQVLTGQLEIVNTATRDNWVSVRDQARKALEETAKSLREVEY
jgi:hypothetical protein